MELAPRTLEAEGCIPAAYAGGLLRFPTLSERGGDQCASPKSPAQPVPIEGKAKAVKAGLDPGEKEFGNEAALRSATFDRDRGHPLERSTDGRFRPPGAAWRARESARSGPHSRFAPFFRNF